MFLFFEFLFFKRKTVSHLREIVVFVSAFGSNIRFLFPRLRFHNIFPCLSDFSFPSFFTGKFESGKTIFRSSFLSETNWDLGFRVFLLLFCVEVEFFMGGRRREVKKKSGFFKMPCKTFCVFFCAHFTFPSFYGGLDPRGEIPFVRFNFAQPSLPPPLFFVKGPAVLCRKDWIFFLARLDFPHVLGREPNFFSLFLLYFYFSGNPPSPNVEIRDSRNRFIFLFLPQLHTWESLLPLKGKKKE